MHPKLLEAFTTTLFKVLDITKNGSFKKEDLYLFLRHAEESCDLKDIGELNEHRVDTLLKEIGVHDLKKINQNELVKFMALYPSAMIMLFKEN